MFEESTLEKLTWKNEKRRLGDLIPHEDNPRKISDQDRQKLVESLEEFGQPQPIAIEPDNSIVDGHQRNLAWATASEFGADYVVDVRVSSRPLTERERKKLTVMLHEGATGEWDWDKLAEWGVDGDDLLDWGFEDLEWDLDDMERNRVDLGDFDDVSDPDIQYRVMVVGLGLQQANQLEEEIRTLTSQEVKVEQYRS